MIDRRIAIPIMFLFMGVALGFTAFRTQPAVTTIGTSWGFDLANPAEVAGYAHIVVVGQVARLVESSSETLRTIYAVTPTQHLKGSTPSEILVSQLGVADEASRMEMEEQPLLQVGDTYVMGLIAPSDPGSEVLSLIEGPVSGQPATELSIATVVEGIARSIWPSALKSSGELNHIAAGVSWAVLHAGFTVDSAP